MLPTETSVAILIPAYGRVGMTLKAIRCALATGAGEVIVSEDASGEDVSELGRINDQRYRFVEQPGNLGLWRNHLALLRLTEKKWIKFLQTDDSMTPDCLRTMCAAVGPETTLASALPVYRDLDTGETESRYELEAPLRWPAGEYVDRMARVGNEPGRPSYTLFRRDALLDTEEAWRNDMSCDLTANAVAASRGEVVLLPPGGVTCGIHAARDGALQSFELLARRLAESLAFLSAYPDARVQRFASIYGAIETLGLLRTFIGKRRRGVRPRWLHPCRDLVRPPRVVRLQHLVTHAGWACCYYRHKFNRKRPIHIRRFDT